VVVGESEDGGGRDVQDGVPEDLAGVDPDARERADMDDPAGNNAMSDVEIEDYEVFNLSTPRRGGASHFATALSTST
jgi:hypothetical protein